MENVMQHCQVSMNQFSFQKYPTAHKVMGLRFTNTETAELSCTLLKNGSLTGVVWTRPSDSWLKQKIWRGPSVKELSKE